MDTRISQAGNPRFIFNSQTDLLFSRVACALRWLIYFFFVIIFSESAARIFLI